MNRLSELLEQRLIHRGLDYSKQVLGNNIYKYNKEPKKQRPYFQAALLTEYSLLKLEPEKPAAK